MRIILKNSDKGHSVNPRAAFIAAIYFDVYLPQRQPLNMVVYYRSLILKSCK